MHQVRPKVFLIGETKIRRDGPIGLQAYLDHIGASDWSTDAPSDAEELIEVYGRLCYRSWGGEGKYNPNVQRVREGNAKYIDHLVRVAHGSVTEQAVCNFVFADVSRVLSHELVRHRVGTAVSQESLRFVRLDDLGQWLPTCIVEDETAMAIFTNTFEHLEELQIQLALHFKLDEKGVPFAKKKEVTSAMRRIAPIGLATTVGWSANLRTIRWVIESRTASWAEEEIRLVFDQVARIMQDTYPNLFSDLHPELVDGINEWKTPNSKI